MSRLRGTRVATVVAVGVALLGVGCRALLDLQDDAPLPQVEDAAAEPVVEASTGVDVVSPVTPDAAPTPCPLYVPPEGVYSYTTESIAVPGREEIFSLNADGSEKDPAVIDEAIGPTFTATLRHTGAGGFTFRVDFNAKHFDEYTFIAHQEAGLTVPNVLESLLAIPISVTCAPAVAVIRCPMVLDASWAGAGSGKFNGSPFDAKLSYVFADTFDWAVNGALVPTYHVVETRALSGAVAGTEAIEYWFAKKNGLLIHSKVNVGTVGGTVTDGLTFSLFGPAEYKAAVEFKITSLSPKPLPDAGADGG